MIRKIFFIACVLLFSGTFYGQAHKITGIWLTKDGRSQINIYKKNNKYYGKIAWIRKKEDRNKKDTKNPDPALRNRKILGLEIIKGFTYDRDEKEWSGGKVYDPESGKFYNAFMWFEDADYNTLYLKGYVMGMRWLGRIEEWTREQELRK
jgi:uncharacterized protein (DUF2147 family)